MGWIYGGLTLALAAWFGVSFRLDRGRSRNPVLLGGLLVSAGLWLLVLASDDLVATSILEVLLLLLAVAFALVLPLAALANGVVMWRREAHRIANLLTPAAGIALLVAAAIALLPVTSRTPGWLVVAAAVLLALAGWLGVAFVATLLYAVAYTRVAPRTSVGPLVVLGAGLWGGEPDVLASRPRTGGIHRTSHRGDQRLPRAPHSDAGSRPRSPGDGGGSADGALLPAERVLREFVAILARHPVLNGIAALVVAAPPVLPAILAG